MGVEQNPRASEALNRGASGPARMPRLIAPDNSSAVPIVVSCPLSRLRGGPTLLGPDTTPPTSPLTVIPGARQGKPPLLLREKALDQPRIDPGSGALTVFVGAATTLAHRIAQLARHRRPPWMLS